MKRSAALSWALMIGIGQFASCSTVSVCDTVDSEHPSTCDSTRNLLQVSCPATGRLPLVGSDPLQLHVASDPAMIVPVPEGAPPLLLSAQLPSLIQVNVTASLTAADTVELTSKQELGAEPGPVHFTLTRGRWHGDTPGNPALSCRLFRMPNLDSGHANSYPRASIPWKSQVRNVMWPVQVQIGSSAGSRSVLVTEELDPLFPGRWLERYTLAGGSLVANLDPADAVWKPLRDQYGSEMGIQTAHSKNGLIIYSSAGLFTISLQAVRTASGLVVPPAAQLVASVDRDWFLLGDDTGVTAYRFDGSTVTQLGKLAISTGLMAMRAARSAGSDSDESRAFDAIVLSKAGTFSVLRLVNDQLQSTEIPGLDSLSRSASKLLPSDKIPDPSTVKALAIGDLDGDGLQDLIVWDSSTGNIFWAPQSGAEATAKFEPLGSTSLTIADLKGLAAGDVDGDSHLDLAVVAGNKVSVYLQP